MGNFLSTCGRFPATDRPKRGTIQCCRKVLDAVDRLGAHSRISFYSSFSVVWGVPAIVGEETLRSLSRTIGETDVNILCSLEQMPPHFCPQGTNAGH